ncbi:Imm3 family immunity protein [Paenibacillus taichungensis]|uniref:Imm3 family immunity protein n=1 Tax=Paenibacillus taichungensis TaxID=484184 RepID=UPI002DBBEC59|nr:Imm3 family immunity protein [Paenibacillus taichungensis]MEC0105616.1 Imm3 family immunity protein [Paenibacillus taichungensis]MEC0198108.1 Imm3 family immunity protein [Paenibacillus taichungensis]
MDLKWEYDELFESFVEDYNSYKNNNMSDRESLARTFGEYETVLNEGEMEKAVIHVLYGELLLRQSKVLVTAKRRTKEDLLSINLNKLKMEVTDDQFKDILVRRDEVLQELDMKKLDYCPEVRWYYFEITDKVKEYFLSQNLEALSQVEIVNNILERFKRDCMNTLSENITIKTTLLEMLLLNDIPLSENIRILKSELENFDFNEVGEQLSEDEKLDLSIRIKEVLSKL